MIMKSIVLLVIFIIGLCLPGCGNSAPSHESHHDKPSSYTLTKSDPQKV